MTKKLYDEYGRLCDPDLRDLDNKIFNLVNDYLIQQIKEDIELKDIQAINQILCSVVNVACSTNLMRVSIKKR